MDGLARASLALPLLDWAVDGEFILGDDGDEGCRYVSLSVMKGYWLDGENWAGMRISVKSMVCQYIQ